MSSKPVTLTKMCELHGIDIPQSGDLASRFKESFLSAEYSDEAGEWRMVWKKGTYADSNAKLEAFFAEQGVAVSHIDKC